MPGGSSKKIPFKRRRKGLTDYRVRKAMILSGRPILVVRKTNSQVIVQVVKPEVKGDVVIAQATGKELKDRFKWPASCKNTPAAYLTGYLASLRALKAGVKEAVPYIGLHRAVRGARVFAALKGAIDAGLEIPHDPEVLPSEERIKGLHVVEYAKQLKVEAPDRYEKLFSAYVKENFDPERMPEAFEDVKKRIEHSISMERASQTAKGESLK
ncbi:MAG: 50S ribosomal protein L18 [Candidatus Nezhaarchaeota archaeon]|nr:50S ribosomal protein L18 [Candidatus Nezhaarchaeota archaeon]